MSTVEHQELPAPSEETLRKYLPRAFARKLAPALPPGAQYRLILALPGTRVRVPAKPDPDHPLAAALSTDELAALCTFAKGQRIDIPVGRRLEAERLRKQIFSLSRDGHCAGEIARRAGCTTRWVRKVLSACAAMPSNDSTPPGPHGRAPANTRNDHLLPVGTESTHR